MSLYALTLPLLGFKCTWYEIKYRNMNEAILSRGGNRDGVLGVRIPLHPLIHTLIRGKVLHGHTTSHVVLTFFSFFFLQNLGR